MKSIDLVTITFNSEKYLRRCFNSVLLTRSFFKNYIVIDGGSTDNTLNIINEFSSIITTFVSEPDNGISDAFNKGLIKCSSDFILLLNSDDWLLDRYINEIFRSIDNNDEIICTNMQSFSDAGYVGEYQSRPPLIPKFNSMLHPGCIVAKSIYENIGVYDLSLKVGMDYDFFSRCYISGVKFKLIDLPLVAFYEGGTSRIRKYLILKESFALRRKYHGAYLPLHELKQLISRILGDALSRIGLKTFVKKVLKNMDLGGGNMNSLEFNRVCHDEIAYKYSKKHLDIFNEVEQDRLSVELKQLKQHISLDSNVLDFGCGSGNLTDHLINFGFCVVSADISKKFLNLVAERYDGNPRHSVYLLSGHPALDLQEMKFDAICIYSVLHHVPNYLECLQSLARRTLPGGVIYIDHEASPDYWINQASYRKLQNEARFRKFIINYRKFFSYSWYLTKIKRLTNPRYQEEGDIHVWEDDHIEWDLIDDTLQNFGFDKIYSKDYLVYQNHYGLDLYDKYKEMVSDMRLSIYKRR